MTEKYKDLDEERFSRWINRLKTSIQAQFETSPNTSNKSLNVQLIDDIHLTLVSETSSIPKWMLKARNQEDIIRYLIATDDLRFVLRHFVTPHALQAYSQFTKEYESINDSMDVTDDDNFSLFTQPTNETIAKFFTSLSSGQQDDLLMLCKLADIHLRIHRAASHDERFLNHLLQSESNRISKSRQNAVERLGLLEQLCDSKEDAIFKQFSVKAKSIIQEKSKEYSEAVAEEERARIAYELAKDRTKSIQQSMNQLENSYLTINDQRLMLFQININRYEIEKFNELKSLKRTEIYSQLTSYLSVLRESYVNSHVYPAISQLFTVLSQMFNEVKTNLYFSTSSESEQHIDVSGDANLYYSCRIGVEIMKLWKKIGNKQLDHELESMINHFIDHLESIVNKINGNLRNFPSLIHGCDEFHDSNSTVVLYFDHLLHNTPPDHIESEARVQTSLKLVMNQSKSSVITHESVKSLHIIKCNEIVSAPYWIFPLVHSPQYLSHLWSLAEEAKEFDLLVPLEFDTEWESLEDTDNENLDKHHQKITSKKTGVIKGTLLRDSMDTLIESSSLVTNEDQSKQLSKILEPLQGDDLLAKAFFSSDMIIKTEESEQKKDSQPRKRRRSRIGRQDNDNKHDFNKDRRYSINKTYSRPSVDIQVKTPYGQGVLMSERIANESRDDHILPVSLKWGAIGYFHISAIKVFIPRKFGGVPENILREILFDDYSNVKPFNQLSDGRFGSADAVIHKIYTRMVDASGMQRPLTEAMGIDRAKASLWVHGRTGSGLSNEVECGVMSFLYSIFKTEVDEKIANGEKSHVLKYMSRIRSSVKQLDIKSSQGEYRDMHINDIKRDIVNRSFEYKASSDNKGGDGDDNSSDGNSTKEEKRKKKRTVTSSSTKRRSRGNNDEDSDDSNSDGDESVKKVRRRSGPTPTIIPSSARPEDIALKTIMKRVMDERKISQGAVAKEYCARYNSMNADQHKISMWLRYRLNAPLNEEFNVYAAFWLRDHYRYLDHRTCEVIRLYLEWKNKKNDGSAVPDDYNSLLTCINNADTAIARKIQKLSQEEDNDIVILNHKIVDVLRSMDLQVHVDQASSASQITDVDEKIFQFIGSNDIITVSDLHKRVQGEIKRRRLVVYDIAQEFDVDNVNLSNEYLDFVTSKKGTNLSKLLAIRIIKWLMTSITLPNAQTTVPSVSTEVVKVNENGVRICQFCGTERSTFSTELGMSMHISWCRRRSNANPTSSSVSDKEKSNVDASSVRINDRLSGKSNETQKSNDTGTKSLGSIPQHRLFTAVEHCGDNKDDVNDDTIEGKLKYVGNITQSLNDSANDSSEKIISTVSTRDRNYDVPMPLNKKPRTEESEIKTESTTISTAMASTVTPIHSSSMETNVSSDSKSTINARNDSNDTSQLRAVTGKTSEPLFSESAIILADKFPSGSHYYSCEICKEAEALLLCVCCPCSYHPKCVLTAFNHKPSSYSNYLCGKCEEVHANKATEMSTNKVLNTVFMLGRWILLYSVYLHRWRQAFVIKNSPKVGVYLIKFWRSDNKGGKMYWMDISQTKVLLLNSAPFPFPNIPQILQSKSANSISTTENTQTDEKSMFPELDKYIDEASRRKIKIQSSSRNMMNSKDDDDSSGQEDSEDEGVMTSGMTDTYVSAQSVQAALCATGIACRAVDIAMNNENTNVFACIRPPGHHAGRYGCTDKCLSTGFCLLNNAVIALIYSRIRWGLKKVAIVDIDVHFGNGTASLVRNDPDIFFASVHMVYHDASISDPLVPKDKAFYPEPLGSTECYDNFISIAVKPTLSPRKQSKKKAQANHDVTTEKVNANDGEISMDTTTADSDNVLRGPEGYRKAIEQIIEKMKVFGPELLIISAGFDGYYTDPIGCELDLNLDDYNWSTRQLTRAMDDIHGRNRGKIVSLLEGGYDTQSETMGLAKCVNAHVEALRRNSDS